MKQVELTVERNGKIAANVFEMVLSGDTSAITAPGQFINIKLKVLIYIIEFNVQHLKELKKI